MPLFARVHQVMCGHMSNLTQKEIPLDRRLRRKGGIIWSDSTYGEQPPRAIEEIEKGEKESKDIMVGNPHTMEQMVSRV